MAHILKIAALLSSLLIVVSATRSTLKNRDPILDEMKKSLKSIDKYAQDHHHKTMVSNVFGDKKKHSDSEIFCKAAKVIESLPFHNAIKHFKKLQHNLMFMGKPMSKCAVDDNSKIEFKRFLDGLLKFLQTFFLTSHKKN